MYFAQKRGSKKCRKNFAVGQMLGAQKSHLKLLVLDIEQVIYLQPTAAGFEHFWKIGRNFSSVG